MKQISRLAVQAVSSVLAGALCAGATGFIVFQMLYSENRTGCDGLFTVVAAMLAAILVYPMGVALGTYLAGRLLEKEGSPWLTFLGSATGALLFFFCVVAFPNHGIIRHLVLFAAFTPILAIVGFYIRGKLKNPTL
jgi:hypothetical protein